LFLFSFISNTLLHRSSKLNAGLKPTPDGTFKVPGEALPQYVLEIKMEQKL
jgi:hypothetical protein